MGFNHATIVAGDSAPDLVGLLANVTGPQNLMDASVVVRLKRKGDDTVLTGACTIDVPPSAGIVRYAWTTETLVPAEYLVEWQVTFSSGDVQMFPNEEPLRLTIRSRVH